MADFKKAMALVEPNEGWWVNDPDDGGKETYRGIARAYWPKWQGWAIIDSLKGKNGVPVGYKGRKDLANFVEQFYKVNFWDKISGDRLSSQLIANQVMDTAVNEGISKAVRRLQLIYGVPQNGVIDQVLLTKIKKSSV